jgi:hypothetical protein
VWERCQSFARCRSPRPSGGYRLHVLQKPTTVNWGAPHGQFGVGFKAIRHFRPTFLGNLRLALAAYPDARVDEQELEWCSTV